MPATRRSRRSETARVGGEWQSVVHGFAVDTEGTRSDVKESREGASSYHNESKSEHGGDELNSVGRSTQTVVRPGDSSKGSSSTRSDDGIAARPSEGKQGCTSNSAQEIEKKRPQHRRRKPPITQSTLAADRFRSPPASPIPATNTDSSTPSSEGFTPMTRSRMAHLRAICSKTGVNRVPNRRGTPARKASNSVCDADIRQTTPSTSPPSLSSRSSVSLPSSPDRQPVSPWRGSRPFPPRARLPAVDDTQPTLCRVPKVSRPTTNLRSLAPSTATQCQQAVVVRLTPIVTDAAVLRKTSVESGNQANDGQQALHGHVSASQCLYDPTPTTTGHITTASAPDCVQPGAYSYSIDIPPPTPCTPLDRSLIVPTLLRVYDPGSGVPPLQHYGPFIHYTGYSNVWTARQESLVPTASAAPRFVPFIPYTPPPDTPLMPALPRAPLPPAVGGWYHARDPAPSLERAVGNGDWANAWAAEYLFSAAVSPSAATATMLPPPLKSQPSRVVPLRRT